MDNQQPSINKEIYYQKPSKGFGFIYKYTSPSGKIYIGQTVNTLKDRAGNILNGKKYKKCSTFWKAIQKYKFNNFLVEILEEIPISLLNDREIFYINNFNSLEPNGYNQTYGGDGGKRREVYVYSSQSGEFLEHYSSLTEASLNTGVPIETISLILNSNKRNKAHNLVFLDKYVDLYNVKELLRKDSHYIYVYDENGDYYNEYPQISQAAKDLNISESSIRKCFSGLQSHACQYQFRNEKFDNIGPIPKNSKSSISVLQIDPSTKKIVGQFPSLAAAGRAVGLKSGDGIKKVIQRGKGLSGGYFWQIDEGSTTKYR